MDKLQKAPTRGIKVARDERGITTAEYAVGTVAAVTLVGVVIKIVTSKEFYDILMQIIKWIIEIIKAMG